MSKLRSVNTAFWSDPLIEELNPKEKLLFLYLITNEKTNMLGIYESSIRKMSFETGLSNTEVEAILKRLEGLGRVKHMGNWVLLVNYMKHQNYNTNMKISALNTYKSLPKELKVNKIQYDIKKPSEGFETLLKCLGTVSKYEIEYEVESETELEQKDMSSKLDFDDLVVKYISWFNSTYDRKFNIDRFRTVCTSKLKALLKTYKNDIDAFKQDLTKVAKTVKNDSYHIETKYKHVTPEFLLRPTMFDKFLNTEENAGKKEPVHEYTYNFEMGGTETNKFTHAEHLAYLERYKNAKLVYKSKSEVHRD